MTTEEGGRDGRAATGGGGGIGKLPLVSGRPFVVIKRGCPPEIMTAPHPNPTRRPNP